MQVPMFATHHSPIGAWASLTFGKPDVPVSIELQDPGVKNIGALLAGFATSSGIRSIGFADHPKPVPASLTAEGDKEHAAPMRRDPLAAFGMASADELMRDMTPTRDTFVSGNLRFTTWTPCSPLSDPANGEIPAMECLPAILLEVEVDNTASAQPGTVFLGFFHRDMKRIYAMQEGTTCSLRCKDDWAFTAAGDDVFIVRGLDAPVHLMAGKPFIQGNGMGFLCAPVAAGEKKTLTVAFGVYATAGSNGLMRTMYYYNRHFADLEAVCSYALTNAAAFRARCLEADERLRTAPQDASGYQLFCQAVRAYHASTQLLEDAHGTVHWNVAEGAYLWRNTMDLCADHLAWELQTNPWVVRSLMEDFLAMYAYEDQVTYPGVAGVYPGGLSFTHDMGCYYTYSKAGHSAYERSNDTARGFYFYMTTEELLNGIYCAAGYALSAGNTDWLKRHSDLLPQLMTSLENRDAHEDSLRNGVLKACSRRGGDCGLESTTYDALDHSLLEASGNLYVYIKTWVSLVLLKRCCKLVDDAETMARAERMLARCRASAELFRSETHPWLKANAYQEIPGAVVAAVEPLAVPFRFGWMGTEDEPALMALLREHGAACLREGVCIDSQSGGLRLSSTSRNTWPSKSVLVLYALRNVLGLSVPETLDEQVLSWTQVSAADVTIADQIMADTREVVGAPYYPRIVTAAVWLAHEGKCC